ncbi:MULTISPECIES: YceD family protein [Planktothricoides]|uniref:YceD family protein n=2 Tax=Planktothricoides raciborskii TaxID=132608 RepID=A0AAU8JKR8_9CYAN|nr:MULTISPECIES: YceD family protein [Planktothricoides]KOR37778.1 metal-binding protein [Planktothricoides sp. SR001]MBD2543533.1 DUF177 domain-containing protein [Planktothricoides raciborskii FACHB-1370]MBD2581224.1 DUF177 domain-containing protein [Planktothricoides raciborskii FACHB-1261]
MEPIYIPQLTTAPERTEEIQFEEFFSEFETLTPVKGTLVVKHQGNYLEVFAQAETIVTLTCNRCLQQYNHRLTVDTSELIWLDEAADQPDTGPLERETALEDLVETLSPHGYFECTEWVYEQLCLALPPRQLCDANCLGIQTDSYLPPTAPPAIDHRWASLAELKKLFPN